MARLYDNAETVELIAQRLLPTYHAELATARMHYLFVDKGGTKNGRPVLGRVRKVSGALEFLLEKDFIVEVSLDQWNSLEDSKRQALVDHLLERCTGVEDENSGEMSWKTREPDVNEFATILHRHGAWTEDLVNLVSVAQRIGLTERLQEVEDQAQTSTN